MIPSGRGREELGRIRDKNRGNCPTDDMALPWMWRGSQDQSGY